MFHSPRILMIVPLILACTQHFTCFSKIIIFCLFVWSRLLYQTFPQWNLCLKSTAQHLGLLGCFTGNFCSGCFYHLLCGSHWVQSNKILICSSTSMPGSVLHNLIISSTLRGKYYLSISRLRKLRHREVMELGQSHTANGKAGVPGSRPCPLNHS